MVNTRPANPTTRPGLVVASKPRLKAGEGKKAKQEKKIAKERKEASAKATKDKLANLEVEIVQQQQAQRQLRSQRSKDVKKDPQKEVPAKRKCAPSPEVSETEDLEKSEDEAMVVEPEQPTPAPRRRGQATPVDDESSDLSEPEEDDEPVKKKPKAPKNALRLTVEAAKEKLKRATVPASTASAHSDSAFSADTATTKQQSRVHHWAANVKMASPTSATTSSFSSNSVPRTLSIPATPYAAEEKAVSTRAKGKKAAKEKGKTREVKVKAEPEEDVANLDYGATEDEAPEAEAAKISPLKNGERLTSAALVKCEPVDLSTPGRPKKTRRTVPAQPTRTQPLARTGTKSTASSSHSSVIVIEDDEDDDVDFPQATRAPRNTAKNSDLPQCATINNTWRRVFIPTLLAWLGSLDNPWLSSDLITVSTLRKIWDAVYGADSPYTVVANDRVCAVVNQRVYEWRGAIGSHALRAFEAFFKSKPSKFPNHDTRSAYSTAVLLPVRVFYANPDAQYPSGLYQSTFVAGPLAYHMDATFGAIDVPGLFDRRKDRYPYGAIGLAAAAALRAATLWSLGKVTYDKDGRPVAAKRYNAAKGKESSKDSEFSVAHYGLRTSQLVAAARKLPTTSVDKILEVALDRTELPVPKGPDVAEPLRVTLDYDYSELTEAF